MAYTFYCYIISFREKLQGDSEKTFRDSWSAQEVRNNNYSTARLIMRMRSAIHAIINDAPSLHVHVRLGTPGEVDCSSLKAACRQSLWNLIYHIASGG